MCSIRAHAEELENSLAYVSLNKNLERRCACFVDWLMQEPQQSPVRGTCMHDAVLNMCP